MRLLRFDAEGAARVGAVSDGVITEFAGSWSDLLRQFSGGVAAHPTATGRTWDAGAVAVRAPLPDRPRPVFCLGINYVAHEAEAGQSLGVIRPSRPVVFVKHAEAIADPGEELVLDSRMSSEFDWEVELTVVIGRPGRDIAPERVRDHVAGYTVMNDVTARDLQHGHAQWFIGKNIERSTPVGPWVTTADEVAYPPDLVLSLAVNGVEKQHARTSELIFNIDTIVSTVSRYAELHTGDLFATGTPAGVGFTRTPPEFLRSGDVMVAEIEGIGRLTNGVA
ncbi:MAG: fumarylacetoacetate hydrolase family protein [Candidatus Dormibacteraeota bacterium]|nr:fumarylacetoacetate hydrolase family protein [Candidatus Dormibacteraeota bacterium]